MRQIQHLANTCYISASINALCSSNFFIHKIRSMKITSSCPIFYKIMRNFLRNIFLLSKDSATPSSKFIKAFQKENLKYSSFYANMHEQHSSVDFTFVLLQRINECPQLTPDQTITTAWIDTHLNTLCLMKIDEKDDSNNRPFEKITIEMTYD